MTPGDMPSVDHRNVDVPGTSHHLRGRRSLGRRNLLGLGGFTLLGSSSLLGCEGLSLDPDEASGGSGGGSDSVAKGSEAPMLAEQVEAGDLPPVEERLPQDPLTVQPADRVGTYGGEWNLATLGPDDAWMERVVGYETFTRWTPAFDDVIPNLVTSIEPENDGREYTLELRRGLKWSDGEPITAEDFVWAYEEVLLNTDLYPVPPNIFVVAGEPAEIEADGEHTLRFRFAGPNGVFIQDLATLYSKYITYYPPHFSKKYHQKFNDNIDELVQQEGYDHWADLFGAKHDPWNSVELPRFHPWVPLSVYGEGDRLVYERNPYYWKVDPDGSQLPYIDRLVFEIISDPEVMVLTVTQGDIDMQDRTINDLASKPVLANGREQGNYRFFDEPPSNMNTCIIALNLTHEDPVKREIFQNRDFRIGLSHAINRPEIINTVYQQQGEPYQVAPRPNSPFYDEEMAKQYTEFDVDLANEYLDRAGYSAGPDGMRLGPDGEKISFIVEVPTGFRAEWPEVLEFVRNYWLEVGIDGQIQNEDRSLFDERTSSGQHDAAVWQGEGGGWVEPMLRTDWYFPSQNESTNYAYQWLQWYESNGQDGEEPPTEVRRQMELYGDVRQTIDEDRRTQIMKEVLQISKEMFYCIGTVLPSMSFGIAKNNFHNVPERVPQSFLYPTPGPSNPEQYFMTES